ncbi:MAG TPA: glycosyltransferase [Vicinamibacterales bacterium]|nr:glycosyltransferase [Vicinamibacterales bacterium]
MNSLEFSTNRAPSPSVDPVVSFIIPVRNDAQRLKHCLRTIRAGRHRPADIELVVADNGSTDESASVAREAGATVVPLPGIRLGELRNRAVAAARGDVLAFVDADHEIGPDWVLSALSVLADESVAAVGAPCRPPSPATWVQKIYDRLRRHPGAQEEVTWLGSGNMAVRRSAFERVGGFDTTLETCEDVDLCRKLRANGYRLIGDARLHNIHYGDPRTLRHVFFGELWRGRDNVRVSLRPPRSWRTLVSAAIPLFNLLALALVVVGVLSGTAVGRAAAAIAGACVLVLLGLRAALMVGDAPSWEFPRAFAVAAAYELGRALALTARVGYDRRRRGATA